MTLLKVASSVPGWDGAAVWSIVLLVSNTGLADGGGIGGIGGADIMWSGVGWEGIIVNTLGAAHTVLWISTVLALPELAAWLGRVAILWAWTESLLLAVVLDEEEREWDGDEEEDSSNDGNGESSSLETACGSERWQVGKGVIVLDTVTRSGVTVTIWCIDYTSASRSTIPVDPSDVCKSTSKGKVQDDAEEPKGGDATQAADEEETEDGVDGCGA